MAVVQQREEKSKINITTTGCVNHFASQNEKLKNRTGLQVDRSEIQRWGEGRRGEGGGKIKRRRAKENRGRKLGEKGRKGEQERGRK